MKAKNSDLNIYWKRDEILTRQEKRIQEWNGSTRNKELLIEFKESYINGTKDSTKAKTLWGIRVFCDFLQQDLDKAVEDDIKKALQILNNSKYADETKASIRKSIKQFYKYFQEKDQNIDSKNDTIRKMTRDKYRLIDKIKSTCKIKPISPTEIIEEVEIRQVISKGCRSDMERAFISLLHESGCRIGEFLNIKIKDITQKEGYWIVIVDGKTGRRQVFFKNTIPYLLRWLDFHPTNNPESFLWVSTNNRYRNQPIRYFGAKRLIDRCFERSGINKRHNPHWFRHSRASLFAGESFSEPVRCKLMGWEIGSAIPRRYTHLKDKVVERAYMEAKGIIKEEEKKKEPEPVTCVCGRINESEAVYCSKCGKALSVKTALEEQDYMKKAFELFGKIMSDPKLKAEFELFKGQENV